MAICIHVGESCPRPFKQALTRKPWRWLVFEHIDFDGSLAFNCWLPTDSEETFIMVRWADHKIVGYGNNVPQGLLDEIQTVIKDAELIYIDGNWEANQQKWV